ncbi:MAG: methylated-DNA--[protein]-cysteine S-methyltransferase [Alphaproteobacteria bacterium]|nr:methylated-DNA--[protein]-cysteine S-methyltransferase [Alphaproteobacteria bacterium]
MGTRILDTPLGALILQSNNSAITRVSWADHGNPMPSGQSDSICDFAAKELQFYFLGRLKTFSVPVSLDGSSLQIKVWGLMANIPFGEVLTYGDVARDVGSGPQAVGRACGQNPIPVIIPCHRIVGAGGKLTGFSGGAGIETKAFLLDHESGQGRLL